MKIGRNDPCFCGSGKKYKNCCLNNHIITNAKTVSIDNITSDFLYINETAKQLGAIISEYRLDDIVRAVFSINAWIRNRSALAQTLTLNKAIIGCAQYGSRSIVTYGDLGVFFSAVRPFLPLTSHEDLTQNDFGEVKIKYHDEVFPVILGTGHEHVFAALNYMLSLARTINKDEELSLILRYSRIIIETLANTNHCDENDIVFELPSEAFWNAVKLLFDMDEFHSLFQRLSSIMRIEKCPIEMQHSAVYKGRYYPLFNTSILVDYYKLLLSQATQEDINQHINLTLFKYIENSYNFSPNSPSRVLLSPVVIDNATGKPKTTNHLAFAASDNKGRILIAINRDEFENEDALSGEVRIINRLHKEGGLCFRESFFRKEIHGGYACNIPPDTLVEYLVFDSFTDITDHGIKLGDRDELFSCSALDMFYFLKCMDNIGELIDFMNYWKSEPAQVLAFGGKSNTYFAWKESHRQISQGAIEFSFISIPYGNTEGYIFDNFTSVLKDYPFLQQHKLFSDPFCWRISNSSLGYIQFEHKGCLGYGGEGKSLGHQAFLFLAHNIEFFKGEDVTQDDQTAIRTIDELNQRLFNRYGDLVGAFSCMGRRILQILYMPMQYAKTIDNNGFHFDDKKKLVYSEAMLDEDVLMIRYTVNNSILLQSIMNAHDRTIESLYFLELLKPLQKYGIDSYGKLKMMVEKDSALKKEVDVFTIEQHYFHSNKAVTIEIKEKNFVRARKEIAKACFNSDIQPGEYSGKAATEIVRKVQKDIVGVFDEWIDNFDRLDLHYKILSHYSSILNDINISLKRYASFTDLDPIIKEEFDSKIREMRENSRRDLRTAQYLLESNLSRPRDGKASIASTDDIEYLLAFADWLIVLQDNADNSYYTDFNVALVVDSQYRVETVFTDYSLQQHKQTVLRKYKNTDYRIKSDEKDKEYLVQCAEAFKKDTGVELSILISLLEYLQLNVVDESFVHEIRPNVYAVSRDDLINGFIARLINKSESDRTKTESALDFITIDESKIRYLGGKDSIVLPIWEREKRDNRFDTKPLLLINNSFIFSPVVIDQLARYWMSSIIEWFLPFEVGMDNLRGMLRIWKKRYEDEMVQDIATLFRRSGFDIVQPEADFASLFPKEGYPADLGDYDVLAVSRAKNQIWIIESKVLQKVGSIYEDQMQQKSFFFQHKEDEKFQRRIDYANKNLEKIAASLGLENVEFSLIPYMVTNKVFSSWYKKIDFTIITYCELSQKLQEIS